MKVLEVGSGSSIYTDKSPEHYHIRFMPVCALADIFLDIVPPDKRVVSKIFGDFIVADAQHLPLRSRVFGEVFAKRLIEHIPNYLLFLKESNRVLRKGGKLYLWTPNYFSKIATCKRPFARKTDPSHIHVFTNMRLALALKKVGFRIVALKSSLATYFPIPTYLRWILNFFFAEEIHMVATK